MTNKKLFGKILVGAAVLLLIWFAYFRFSSSNEGKKAPEIDAILYNGKTFKLSELRGTYVLLDFWGSWCGPCRRENKELVRFYHRNKEKVVIVSVALERQQGAWLPARESDGLEWEHHIVLDQGSMMDSRIARNYGVDAIPAKFLIDPDGTIVSRGSLSEMEEIIRKN